MKYRHIVPGEFLARPNRFIAQVSIAGKMETVHVKNTGRCRELLREGTRVYMEDFSSMKGKHSMESKHSREDKYSMGKEQNKPARKTAYDLVAVEKGRRLVNMDSQAPNKVVEEWLRTKELFPGLVLVRPETTYGSSRFDFYLETEKEKIFMEVKGVTLEEDGVVKFPDAPSERAVKHVEELIRAKEDGYLAYILFLIQMEDVEYFTPNGDTHPAFADVLQRASRAGVEILAYDSRVTPEEITLRNKVPVRLAPEQSPKPDGGDDRTEKSIISGDIKRIPEPLLEWYDRSKRILPWRELPTPYRVWVSEIMLQQTRVEAVKPYFERFINRLPDIKSLAEADEEVLLKLWEGLGYYSRVRNLKKAAIRIMDDYGGRMPDEYQELLQLNGIGSYTAGAIASIVFGRPVPAVDGNVLRVISRIRMDEKHSKVQGKVRQDLLEIIPPNRPGDFNQAMMEIGACVCIPRGTPHCGICPLSFLCMAHEAGRETEFPKKALKKQRAIEEKTILVIRDENRAAIRKRPGRGLLAGMYELPAMNGFRSAEEVTEYLRVNGLKTVRIRPLAEAKHIFSHREWHMIGYMVRVDELEPRKLIGDAADWIFIEPEETREKYPIPTAFATFAKNLNIKLGNEKY